MSAQDIVFSVIALVPAFVLHELAHAWTAVRLGDPTPRLQGRLTLNPLKHLDPIGTLLLVWRGFGWAKPVQVNPYNFSNPRRDHAVVAAAGPLSNFLMALLAALVLVRLPGASRASTAASLLAVFFYINVSLFVFNLIPIPPLDGSRILAGLLPQRQADAFDQLERYGWAILMLILAFGVLDFILNPLTDAVVGFIRVIVNLGLH